MQGLYCVRNPGRPVVCCSSVLISSAAKHPKMQGLYLTHGVFFKLSECYLQANNNKRGLEMFFFFFTNHNRLMTHI